MNYKDVNHEALNAIQAIAEDSQNDKDDSRRLAPGGDRHIDLSVAVEEIFLEGDSAVVLHHEAGSARTMSLLESAEVLESRIPRRK